MKKYLFLLILLLVPQTGAAQPNGNVEQLYIDGKFEEAVTLGRKMGDAEGLKFALRAQLVLAQYIYEPEKRLKAIETAIKDADKAEAMAPEDVEFLISKGILIGLRGRYNRSISDGKEAYGLFLRALDIDPDQSWALGAAGSWNAETLAEAGSVAGHLIFGAKKKVAWEYFSKSLEVDPDNLAIRAAYIRAMFKIKPKKNFGVILENFEYVLNAKPKNALERIIQEQIRQIKEAYYKGDTDRLKLLLNEAVPIEMAAKDDQG